MDVYKQFEDRTVLVTGATGLIGYSLVKELINNTKNCNVLALGRSAEKLSQTFSEFNYEDRLTIIEHDITQKTLNVNNTPRLDYIFHAAGPQEREFILNNPLEVIRSNYDGLTNCLKYLVKQEQDAGHKGRAIILSSLTIYGSPFENKLFTVSENDSNYSPFLSEATSSYSESKRMLEVLANAYHRMFEVDYIICRLSTVFGYAKNPTNTAFFEFLDLAQNGENILVEKKHGPKRDNLYIKDAVSGLLYGAAYGEEGGVYNISSNGDKNNLLSIAEIAVSIAELANQHIHITEKVKVTYKDETYRTPTGLALDNTKLKALNWTLNFSFEEAMIDLFSREQSK